MLARLDRFADREAGEATHQAARLVAAEFDGFLDLIDRDEGPARTGVFLAARIAGDEVDPDLGAVLSLARADRWLRTGRGAACEVEIADLDPTAHAHWTAEQWLRAEAAGMLAFTAPSEPARHSPLSPLHPEPASEAREQYPVWWDDIEEQWLTRFAPPPDFLGEEDGEYGDDGYSRTLSPDEEAAVEAQHRAELATLHAAGAPERDAWFAALSQEDAAGTTATALPPESALAGDGTANLVPDAAATDPALCGDAPAPDHSTGTTHAPPPADPGKAGEDAAAPLAAPLLSRNTLADCAKDNAATGRSPGTTAAEPSTRGSATTTVRPDAGMTVRATGTPSGGPSGNGSARVSLISP